MNEESKKRGEQKYAYASTKIAFRTFMLEVNKRFTKKQKETGGTNI